MIPNKNDALYINLMYIPFEYLKLPLYAVKDGVTLDTGDNIEGWFMTDKIIEVNPESPPYLPQAPLNMQLIMNGKQNTKLVSYIWALSQAMNKYTINDAGQIQITIIDEGKLTNQMGIEKYKNKWVVFDGTIPDDLEVIKTLMNRRKYRE